MKRLMNKINKKAFTLVEMLAVIVIIGVVLTITIPSVTNIISSNYHNAYSFNLKAIEKATKDYITKNSIRIDETGQKIITIQKLIEESLIKEVRDPQTKDLCEGYVVVSKSGRKNIYEPFLKCGNTYLSDNYDSTNLEAPIITLLGDDPTYMYINEEYVDVGVTAKDYQGFDLTDDVKLTSNLNPSIPGEYFLTYTVSDDMGNKGEITRKIIVVDNLSPVISFSPNNNDVYVKKVDVTIKVDDKGGVDNSSLKYVWTTSFTQPSPSEFTLKYKTNELVTSPKELTGTYYLWAMAKDKEGNAAVKGSEGFKLDNTPPAIIINGCDVVSVAKGSSYNDDGATASDSHSGLKGSVTSSGTVNPNIVGTYTITYKAEDKVGNLGVAIRTVNVIDVDAPVITINGSNPTIIEVGTAYSDAGATALDDEDGNVTSKITKTGAVNPNALGTYTITYRVSDNAGNTAIATRTVKVIDTTKPTVAFGTNGNSTYAKSRSTKVTVNDNVEVSTSSLKYVWNTSTTQPSEGSITTSFTNGGTINSPSGVTGDYYLWILAKDNAGNTTIARSNVFKLDNTLPVIALTGNATINVNAGTTYSDAGATASDSHSGISGSVSTTSNVNTSIVGTYTVTYNVSDNAGNTATSSRTVKVVDATKPTVAFGTNGNATYAKSRSTKVTVSDTYGTVNTSSLKYLWNTSTTQPSEGSITTSFTNGGTINSPSGVTGDYYLWILAKDNSGNTTIARSNVFKLDNTLPVITRTGNATVNVNRGSSYTDAGATATDNVDGSITVTSSGTVNINIVGTYTITYNATDSSGNTAIPVTRTVNVVDVSAPVITIKGSNPVSIEYGSPYSDAGATAVDDVDGNVTSKITTTGTVNPNVLGTYTITYTVKDTAGNTATATRTVNVIDNVLPTIAFGTNGNSTYAKSRSTTVTVSDNVGVNTSSLKYLWNTSTTTPSEASITTSFTNGGTINTPAGVTGDYYLWILGKDTSGNTLIQRSNVFKLDNTIPVITVNPVSVTITEGSSYTDTGVSASDAHSGLNGSVTSSGTVNPNVPGTYTITYNISDKAGNMAVTKTRTVTVLKGDYNLAKGVNYPKLAPGMTPIKLIGTTEVTTTENDPDWYDYSTKKWANAKTADGSYWVWIPRYIYKISSGWHSKTTGTIQVQFSKGANDNWNNSSIGNIDTGATSNASNNKWTNHPAFTFGSDQLTGFWVAKYEATAAEGVANFAGGDNVTSKTVKIIPNVQSWRYITTGNAFTAVRNMESNSVYGWPTASGLKEDGTYTTDTNNIDTHLMKNSEWGAVAYLSKSQYGKNTEEIAVNSSSSYITGTGIFSASTTGNTYGIYDISGGAWEMVSAYVDNGHDNLRNFGLSIINAVSKYKDVYLKGSTDNAQNNYGLAINKKGDAVYETSNNIGGSYSWFNDYAYMPTAGFPWFLRGGGWDDGGSAGAFYFNGTGGGGGSSSISGFRPVLVVHAGL